MDAYYMTDYGNCKNSDFLQPGGGSTMFLGVLANFFNFFY